MRATILVFLGSGLGGVLRHLVGVYALRHFGPDFPYGTLFVNVLGAGLIGLVAGVFAARSSGNTELQLFLATGLIGGFTTWSTFALDTVTLWQRQPWLAVLYVGSSFVASIVALVTVLQVMRHFA